MMGDNNNEVVIDIEKPLLGIKECDNAMNKKAEAEQEKDNDDDGVGECRFCHQDDSLTLLEAPCFCNGTLKNWCGSYQYAHRGCVQLWCNTKGNITCEICNQPYQPNYTAVLVTAPRASRRARLTLGAGGGVNNNNEVVQQQNGGNMMTADEDTTIADLLFGTGLALCSGIYLLIFAIELTAIFGAANFLSPP